MMSKRDVMASYFMHSCVWIFRLLNITAANKRYFAQTKKIRGNIHDTYSKGF